ncbi:PREDICTED: pentatricopeptide repeat-containing protein At4g14820-like [Camelina sativa]|uniref:Pentatricopeptide repeat-containing protein At4g14820-like n=1 Tax=Camelina sativa TaxID=90675 RepID=A0ABM1QHA1_CAMSA|nr:PREDICTED: pentatricopeptide repeat-containing protein At4g14820-like [Camelina sativa]
MHRPIHSTAVSAADTILEKLKTLNNVKQLHAHILRTVNDHNLNSTLFNLCISSSSISLSYALSLFSSSITPPPESLEFNPFLRDLSRSNEPRATILFYQRIRHGGGRLDQFSFPPVLKAASKVSAFFEGMEIHGVAFKIATLSDPFVETCLMDMYATCGRINCARKVFDEMSHRDVVTWNTMIERYCRCGRLDEAFKLFEEMKCSNVLPDEMILCNIVSACCRTGNMSYNRAIYDFLVENDVRMDTHLLTALVTMYAGAGCMDMAREFFEKLSVRTLFVSTAMVSGYSKAGRLDDARVIFDQTEEKDLVCWTTMISAYAESDHPQEALRVFEEMRHCGIEPDVITMFSVISACASLGTLDNAKWVHCYTHLNGFKSELSINNALINMYSKCGSLDGARDVFGKMPTRNVVSWSSIINAYSMHGKANDALISFARMRQENVVPNDVTFVGVLYGCSHSGLVEEGKKIFASMTDEYNITPKLEHYGCMVDLFGRANRLQEAVEVIESMPMAPNVVIWGSLMSACRVHGELELGEFAAKHILELEPDHDGALVLMSNIYAREQRWGDVRKIRRVMEEKNVFKEKGLSRIDLNGISHEFLIGDKRHKQSDEIYATLDDVVSKLKLAGYVPHSGSVLVNDEEEEKRDLVLWQ